MPPRPKQKPEKKTSSEKLQDEKKLYEAYNKLLNKNADEFFKRIVYINNDKVALLLLKKAAKKYPAKTILFASKFLFTDWSKKLMMIAFDKNRKLGINLFAIFKMAKLEGKIIESFYSEDPSILISNYFLLEDYNKKYEIFEKLCKFNLEAVLTKIESFDYKEKFIILSQYLELTETASKEKLGRIEFLIAKHDDPKDVFGNINDYLKESWGEKLIEYKMEKNSHTAFQMYDKFPKLDFIKIKFSELAASNPADAITGLLKSKIPQSLLVIALENMEASQAWAAFLYADQLTNIPGIENFLYKYAEESADSVFENANKLKKFENYNDILLKALPKGVKKAYSYCKWHKNKEMLYAGLEYGPQYLFYYLKDVKESKLLDKEELKALMKKGLQKLSPKSFIPEVEAEIKKEFKNDQEVLHLLETKKKQYGQYEKLADGLLKNFKEIKLSNSLIIRLNKEKFEKVKTAGEAYAIIKNTLSDKKMKRFDEYCKKHKVEMSSKEVLINAFLSFKKMLMTEENREMILKDPLIDKAILIKDTWVKDPQLKVMIARNLFYKKMKINKENVEQEHKNIMEMRKNLAKIPIFKNRRVIYAAHTEKMGGLMYLFFKIHPDYGKHRFGTKAVLDAIKNQTKLLEFFRPQENVEDIYKTKLAILERIRNAKGPLTYVFDGHGGRKNQHFAGGFFSKVKVKGKKKTSISTAELAEALLARAKKYPNEKAPILIFNTCYNHNYIRDLYSKLEGVKNLPITLGVSEYNLPGYSEYDTKYGNYFNEQVLRLGKEKTTTIGTVIRNERYGSTNTSVYAPSKIKSAKVPAQFVEKSKKKKPNQMTA